MVGQASNFDRPPPPPPRPKMYTPQEFAEVAQPEPQELALGAGDDMRDDDDDDAEGGGGSGGGAAAANRWSQDVVSDSEDDSHLGSQGPGEDLNLEALPANDYNDELRRAAQTAMAVSGQPPGTSVPEAPPGVPDQPPPLPLPLPLPLPGLAAVPLLPAPLPLAPAPAPLLPLGAPPQPAGFGLAIELAPAEPNAAAAGLPAPKPELSKKSPFLAGKM